MTTKTMHLKLIILLLFLLSKSIEIKLETLLVGTTGDYKPVTYLNPETGEMFAENKNYTINFIQTTWPTLMNDTLYNNFQIAVGGITKTKQRLESALMSTGYLTAGKTFLMRKEDTKKYTSIESVNKPSVRVMINPGGTNELFARANLTNANIVVHEINQEIPQLISEGKADIMVTEIMEGFIYARDIENLAVPFYKTPPTNQDIGA